jgi:hypothetical protein
VQEIQALRTFWVEYYGTVAPTPASAPDPEVLTLGAGVHIDSCAGCHAPAQAAFISYPVARLIKPVATSLDEAGFVSVLWYIHVLSCCLGLVFIAFGKMFHIIGTPVSIFVAEVAGQQQEPAACANRQVIELDGCSHGGTCHDNCLVRQRRLERLAEAPAYGPMAAYLGQKSARDLGSRDVSG